MFKLSGVTLGATGLAGWYFTRGKPVASNEPPINASSKEEETYVKYVLHGHPRNQILDTTANVWCQIRDFLKKKETETKQ